MTFKTQEGVSAEDKWISEPLSAFTINQKMTINKQLCWSGEEMTDFTKICSHRLPDVISVMYKADILNLCHQNPGSQKAQLFKTKFTMPAALNDSKRNSVNLSD